MSAKHILITGATSGIGKETALGLAKAGHCVHVLARDAGKATLLLEELRKLNKKQAHSFVQCDLSSLKSVDTAAHILRNRLSSLDIIINNAGGIFQNRTESADGYELTLALNHLGPFHLTNQLLHLLPEHQEARIINVSSSAHGQATVNIDDIQLKNQWSSITSYGNAKLFNIYSAQYWAEKLSDKGIQAFSLHPGVVNTSFGSQLKGIFKILLKFIKPFMLKAQEGAKTSLFLSLSEQIDAPSGSYFTKCKPVKLGAIALDITLRKNVISQSKALIQKIIGNANNEH